MGSLRRKSLICLLLINIIVFVKSKSLSCSSFPKTCTCSKNDNVNPYLNFHCPSVHTSQVEIKFRPSTTLEVICISNAYESPNVGLMDYTERLDDLSILPNLSVGFVDTVVLKFCPLRDETIGATLQKLGVNKVKNIIIEGSSFENITDTSKYFDNITSDLESLELVQDEIENLDDDVFSEMFNLKKLDLNTNKLIEITKPFNSLINLKDLDLSRNTISELSSESFKGLSSLQILHLWKNKLVNLKDDVFDDLKSLKSLELSRNLLTNISENVFNNLTNLEILNIGFNNFIELPAKLFNMTKKIKGIRIESCKNLMQLPSMLFGNLPLLENITVTYSPLKTLPMDLFYNSTSIKSINFNKNAIISLPREILANLPKLKILQLSGNSLTTVPNDLDKPFPNLLSIDLSFNKISSELTDQVLSSAPALRKLLLQFNRLEKIQPLAFNKNERLIELNLSHNNLTLDEFKQSHISLLNKCTNLEVLDLSYNNISSTSIFPDFGYTKQNLKVLNLRNNKINRIDVSDLRTYSTNKVEINLENNLITKVDFGNLEDIASYMDDLDDTPTVIKINRNPIICDCSAYDLVRYFNSLINMQVRSLIDLKADALVCAGLKTLQDLNMTDFTLSTARKGDYFEGRFLVKLKPKMISCRVDDCPELCECFWRPHDKGYLVDCSNKNLTEMPIITEPQSKFVVDLVEINLENNSIKDAPKEGMGYENVKVLALSNNMISDFNWVPPKIKVLNLDNNNLSQLSYKLIKDLQNITLHNNPWICDCTTVNFSIYVKDHFLPQKSNILCRDSKIKISLLSEKDLCPTHEKAILGITLGLSMILLLTAIMSAFYYKYNEEIRVWMYAHEFCQWLFHEEEIDRNKKYDAFISYSHMDEEFVLKEIVNKLESGPNPYKLCIHIRNWMPGGFIQEQISDSIQNSRRTVIILSPDFLKSLWGQMEFRIAHTKAMSEGITRVIVIIYGDVDLTKDINDEMKAYLKTNTYIKWGSPWFWDRLRYALPHHKNKQAMREKKLDNLSHHLDNMDYINRNSTPNIESIASEHPFLTKENELNTKNISDPGSLPV